MWREYLKEHPEAAKHDWEKEFVKNNFNWDKICNDFLNHLKKHNIGDI